MSDEQESDVDKSKLVLDIGSFIDGSQKFRRNWSFQSKVLCTSVLEILPEGSFGQPSTIEGKHLELVECSLPNL